MNKQTKLNASTVAIAILSTIVLLTVGVGNAQADPPLKDWRAGVANFLTGQAGINITFAPLPDTNYAVSVQQTNSAGYSTTSDCTYFNVLHLRVDGFEVQHKRCDDGVPVSVNNTVQIRYIVIPLK